METGIYLVTAVLTVLWSVLIYRWWEAWARLRDESGLRLLLIVTPSSYFLLVAVSGGPAPYRVDLLGLIVLDGLILLCALLIILLRAIREVDRRIAYLSIVVGYNLIGVLVAAAALLVRSLPPLFTSVVSQAGSWSRLDLLSFAWILAGRPGKQPELAPLVNRVVIALLSYVPIAVVRSVNTLRQRRRLRRDVDALQERIARLERLVVPSADVASEQAADEA